MDALEAFTEEKLCASGLNKAHFKPKSLSAACLQEFSWHTTCCRTNDVKVKNTGQFSIEYSLLKKRSLGIRLLLILAIISGSWLQGLCNEAEVPYKTLLKEAEAGSKDAQFELGSRYFQGRDVPFDCGRGIAWFRKAAEQGDPRAYQTLGECYANGLGVPKDAAQAAEWYKRGALAHFPKSECDLGICYRDGSGVPTNNAESVKWL